MPKFSITTSELWPHKVYYTVTAKTLEAAMAKIEAGEVAHHDSRIEDICGDCVEGVYEIKKGGESLPVPHYLLGVCDVGKSETFPPERRLADFWRSRAGIEYSEFDRLIGEASPVHDKKKSVRILARQEPIDYDLNPDLPGFDVRRDPEKYRAAVGTRLYDQCDATREYVARGLPLARREYYMALALGYIMGDLPYEEFYRTRWFETAKECGFGNYDEKKDQ
jgi:hypothetical protein